MGRLENGILTRDRISQVLHQKTFPYPLLEFLKVWYVLVYKFSKKTKFQLNVHLCNLKLHLTFLFWCVIDIFCSMANFYK